MRATAANAAAAPLCLFPPFIMGFEDSVRTGTVFPGEEIMERGGGSDEDDADKGKNMNPEDDIATVGRDEKNPLRSSDQMIHEETKT